MSFVIEPERRTPRAASYDVVVVGGGIAGAAAALAAAREGARTCLMEKEYGLGGLATLGNVIEYLPICDGTGRKVTGGIAEELLLLSVKDGPGDVPECWLPGGDPAGRAGTRYRVLYNAANLMFAVEELLLEEGVDLWYDTRFCEVARSDDRVTSVIVENKSGRLAVECRVVVDASGDADVCARAGEHTTYLDTNVPAGWFYLAEGDHIKLQKATHDYNSAGGPPKSGGRTFRGDVGREVTEMTIASHLFITDRVAKRSADAGGTMMHAIQTPSIPSFRMTRRLKTDDELTIEDDHRWFDDAIGAIGHWFKPGPLYYIPFSSMVASRNDNLLVAGRCIAVDTSVWNLTRIIPACALTGEAAGVAAAMAVRDTGRIRDVQVGALQERLRSKNVLIEREWAQ